MWNIGGDTYINITTYFYKDVDNNVYMDIIINVGETRFSQQEYRSKVNGIQIFINDFLKY